MIRETDQQNLRPKILVQSVLGLNNGEVIARGNNAAIKHNEVIFCRGKDHPLLAPGRKEKDEGRSSERKDGTKEIIYHTGHPQGWRFADNYGHWCFYSTKPALLGSFIFGRPAQDKLFFPPPCYGTRR
jgi:hypothetical protein